MDTSYLNTVDLPEKEKKILEAAITAFSEKGFNGATTNEIAKLAGVAEGTIFRYFKTKKDILRGIMIQTLNILGKELVVNSLEKVLITAKDSDIREVLKKVIYDRMKLFESVFPMARIVITEALYHEDIRDAIYENIISKALEMFKRFCLHMQEKGLVRSDVEPEVIFRSILGNSMVLIAQKELFTDKFKMDNFDDHIDKMIDIILNGISTVKE